MNGKRLIPALWLILTATYSCRIEPPLHLRKAVEVQIDLTTEMNMEYIWQADWEALWEFSWTEEILGPLYYRGPERMRMYAYTLGPDMEPSALQVHNFMGLKESIPILVGAYDFLFHNNDSEIIIYKSEDELTPVHATTRIISSGLRESTMVRTVMQKYKAGDNDNGDDYTGKEPVAYAPEELFSLYDKEHAITDDLSQYEYIDGRYVTRVRGKLLPSTYIYLIQARLHNNNGRVIGCRGGAAVTGAAAGVNLTTRETWDQTVSIPFNMYLNRDKDPDLLGGRVISFGLKGCRNPYGTDEEKDEAKDARHYLVLSLTYSNGGYRNVRVDITDQFGNLPTGGVITLDLDVDDFPPDDTPVPPPGGETGGFQALINGWDEKAGTTTVIN